MKFSFVITKSNVMVFNHQSVQYLEAQYEMHSPKLIRRYISSLASDKLLDRKLT